MSRAVVTAVRRVNAFTSTQWLAAHLANPRVKLVDASWFMPSSPEKGYDNYVKVRLPSARFFDVDAIADKSSGLPHMLPSAAMFSDVVGGGMGIAHTDKIIVYDSKGLFSAPRVWWTFRLFGAEDVTVLEGGLPAWLADKGPTHTGIPDYKFTPAIFRANFDKGAVKSLDEMVANLAPPQQPDGRETSLVIDARSKGRYLGSEAEPRAGLRGGHIPFSHNVPFSDLVTPPPFQTLKPESELHAIFLEAGINLLPRVAWPAATTTTTPSSSSASSSSSSSSPASWSPSQQSAAVEKLARNAMNARITTTCGSGMTAAVVAFALHSLGHQRLQLYDGSWTEWGQNKSVPVSTVPSVGVVKP